ncbi:MAG: FG-GAP repeat domain-containing protein, partial [Acidimicrobiia bacterium]
MPLLRPAALGAAVLAATVLSPLPGAGPAGAAPAERWHRQLPGAWLYWSSPVLADVDGVGGNDVVVGGLNGLVYALDPAGNPLPGWPARATAAVASSPAVGDLDGDGTSEVVTGVGSLEVPNQRGAINIFNHDGSRRCVFETNPDHGETAVFNAPALGDVDGDGTKDVVFGSFDQRIRVINHRCQPLGSFDHADSLFSAPALADVDGDGDQEIFIGGDASRGPAGQSHDGGTFRSLDYRAGATHPDGHVNLVQRWSREDSRETFQSAAAIGNLDGDAGLEVVTGSGAYWCRRKNQCADSDKVWAFNAEDGSTVAGWPRSVTFNTTFLSAPALGDLDGDGTTDVVVGSNHYTNTNPAGGALEAFYGNGGHRRWENDLEIMASPVIADVDGAAGNEVVIGASRQVFVLDGHLGVLQAGLAKDIDHKSAAVVGEYGPGRFALVSAGFDAFPGRNNEGHVVAYDIAAPKSAPWPMHRKNSHRAGAEIIDPVP